MLKDGSSYINDWLCTDGGDGIRGFVNFGNPRVAYSDYGGKILSGDRTVNISTFSLDTFGKIVSSSFSSSIYDNFK